MLQKRGEDLKIDTPEYVKKAIATLNSSGFEAFVAGGAVRDALLEMCPDDWDITTNALVTDVQCLFDRHFDTGIKHGTVTVLIDKKPIEITTYRKESEYESNRRPKSVIFTSSLAEDLKRRDFTINAMAYNDEAGVIDLFGGVEDLKNKIIRCVGKPDERFNEDALRMMRAVRFAARLEFNIEKDTMSSIKRNCNLLKNISAERIQAELVKTLVTGSNINALFESGIMGIIAPETTMCNLNLVNSVCGDTETKLAALLAEVDINKAGEFFNRLKFDNKTKNNTLSILKGFKENAPCNDIEMRKMLCTYGESITAKIISLQTAINGVIYNELKTLLANNKDKPYALNMLDIDGNDLIAMGITGTDIGRIMKSLLESVIETPERNTKEQLISIARRINNDNY